MAKELGRGDAEKAFPKPKYKYLRDEPITLQGWDGYTLDNRYWRPDAPADWKTLTYTPKDASGNPTSSVPLLAVDRPTVTGANGVGFAGKGGRVQRV